MQIKENVNWKQACYLFNYTVCSLVHHAALFVISKTTKLGLAMCWPSKRLTTLMFTNVEVTHALKQMVVFKLTNVKTIDYIVINSCP